MDIESETWFYDADTWCSDGPGDPAANATQPRPPEQHGFCASLTIYNEWSVFGFDGLYLSAASVQLVVTATTLVYASRDRCVARREEAQTSATTARMVLPAYIRVLHCYCLVTAIAGMAAMVQAADLGHGEVNAWLCRNFSQLGVAVCKGVSWGLYSVMFEGLCFFLMQKSAGARAFRRGLKRSIVIGVIVFLSVTASEWLQVSGSQTQISPEAEKLLGQALQFGLTCGLLLFYGLVRYAPANRMFRRPATRSYSTFWLWMQLLELFEYFLTLARLDAGYCVDFASNSIILPLLSPLVVYRALREDSEYWRGHTTELTKTSNVSKSHSNLNLPLAGRVSLNYGAAGLLTETMDAMQKSKVKLMSFSNLDIAKAGRLDVIGAGGTAKVYRGTYKGEPVAIKLVYPPELTPEEVGGFLAEAAVMQEAGAHRNIVKTFGVCVMPPSIALVLELCDQGDLNSHLHKCRLRNLLVSRGQSGSKLQLEMAMDCAAGVEHLHSHTPNPIIHNDLKSFNVLVCAAATGTTGGGADEGERPYVAKLADLEFGHSRSVGRQQQQQQQQPGRLQSLFRRPGASGDDSMSEAERERPPSIPDTVNWTAPELMVDPWLWPNTATDVWALGMLLFEVFALELPLNEKQCEKDLATTNDLSATGALDKSGFASLNARLRSSQEGSDADANSTGSGQIDDNNSRTTTSNPAASLTSSLASSTSSRRSRSRSRNISGLLSGSIGPPPPPPQPSTSTPYGREYLIQRLTDTVHPLRPEVCGVGQRRGEEYGMDVPDAFGSLLATCWAADPEQRPAAHVIKARLSDAYNGSFA